MKKCLIASPLLVALVAHAQAEWGTIPDPNETWLLQLAGPTTQPAVPAAEKQECKGILKTNHDGALWFEFRPEGICEINKSETGKVLAQCTPGHFCRVYGVVEGCKDSGECSELTNVLQVTRTK